MLGKAAALERVEYSPLGSKLKKKASGVEKRHQGLNNLFKSDEKEEPVIIKKEKPATNSKPKLVYDSKFSFSNYSNIRKYYDIFFSTKCDKLLSFSHG